MGKFNTKGDSSMLVLIATISLSASVGDLNQGMGRSQQAAITSLTTTGRLPSDDPHWIRMAVRFDQNPKSFTSSKPLTAMLLRREDRIDAGTRDVSSPFLNTSVKWVKRATKALNTHPNRFTKYHGFLAAILKSQPPNVSPEIIIPDEPITPVTPDHPINVIPAPSSIILWSCSLLSILIYKLRWV